jgi:hypothetical protein
MKQMIKNSFSLITFLLMNLILFAQTYPCETSRIGKLVTKPLVKDDRIHYENAVTDTKDKLVFGEDFTSINKDDNQNTYVARHRMLDKEKTLDLLFVSNKKTGKCIYQITLIDAEAVPHGIRLDEDGGATDWDENTPLDYNMRKEEQKLVDQWLRYFE